MSKNLPYHVHHESNNGPRSQSYTYRLQRYFSVAHTVALRLFTRRPPSAAVSFASAFLLFATSAHHAASAESRICTCAVFAYELNRHRHTTARGQLTDIWRLAIVR